MIPVLAIQSVVKRLGGRTILDNVSLSAGAGEFIGLIGPNGAGKSTLLRVAAALITPDAGAVSLLGDNTQMLTPVLRARRMAYLPQTREIAWGLSGRDIVMLGRFAYGAPMAPNETDRDAVDKALADCGAAAFADRLVHDLSGGERARIHIARALAGQTPALLADEPIAALDPAHQLSVMALLRNTADAGRMVIAALHDLPLASRYCTRLIALDAGRVAYDGAPAGLPSDTVEKVFSVRVHRSGDGAISEISALQAPPDLRQ